MNRRIVSVDQSLQGAKDRLRELDDGRFYYAFKRTWKNGAKGIYFEGPDFLGRSSSGPYETRTRVLQI